jgi:hypothetical protein
MYAIATRTRVVVVGVHGIAEVTPTDGTVCLFLSFFLLLCLRARSIRKTTL